jgi:tetratricopeptide (TPR) repeat protein
LEDYDKVLEYQNKALEIYKANFGENNPNIAHCYYTIGLVYLGFGDYKTALEYFNKALEIYKAKLGESHPATLQTLEIIDEIKKELEESQGKTEEPK